MDAVQRLEREDLLHFSRIGSIEDLKAVLEAQQGQLMENIQRLAMSDKPEDNAARSRLLGQLELVSNLLIRINK